MAAKNTLERVFEIPASEIEYIADCGSGSYGTVYRAVWKNRLVAVKIPRYRNEKDGEIRHLTVLNHSNIIKFFGIVKKDEKKSLVMEFSEIGSLSQILHELTDIEYSISHVINWGLQTACGLAHLHSLKPIPMMHRDLKPQNILLFNNCMTVKLCDFGTLRTVDTQVTQGRGSIAYMAPEVMKTGSYTEKCDVYSWGVLLWEMITREKPFRDLRPYQVLLQVGAQGLRLKPPEEIHQIFIKLMVSSWDDESEKRPDMKTVQEIMQQLFTIVVDEKDPSRCTSLSIPNLSGKINDENSVSDSCRSSRSQKQSTIHLRARNIRRMASFNSIIDHCFFRHSIRHGDESEIVLEIPASEIGNREYCGRGSYGTVYRAVWRDRLVAIKEPHENEGDEDEIRHLINLNHPNIIEFFGILKEDGKHSLVMEFSEIGSMFEILHKRPEVKYSLSHVINWSLQTANGLDYLHSFKPRPMMHRDLKPQNILLFNGGRTIKLCDFGTLRTVDTQVTQGRGSIAYMAPEVMKTGSYTEKCDVYSWGVLLWEMITREKPFKSLEPYQIMFKVGEKGLRLQPPEWVHPIFPVLMSFCWNDKPENRPDMTTVQDIMKQLFAIVVGENDPSRCTSLNIPNLNDKITNYRNGNSVSDPCETSELQVGIDQMMLNESTPTLYWHPMF